MKAATVAHQLRQLEADLAAREAALAHGLETLNQSAAVQEAYRAGVAMERERILTLITVQLEQLDRRGLNALSLRTLRSSISP